MAPSSSSSGPGFLSLLLLVFVCAKIFGFEPVASWPWWLVTAPFWIPLLIALIAIAVVCLVEMRK